MNIRLIEPKAPGITVFDQFRLPRLGLPLLGRLLADRGHDVRIYVEALASVNWTDIAAADLVGFSTTTATVPAAYAYARRVRAMGIPTVAGGPHVTFLADEGLRNCDYVVRGEGQVTMLALVEALERGAVGEADLAHILGLSYHGEDGRPVHNADRPPCAPEAFAALPAPALDLIVGHERMNVIPIMTQWGCPYACDFCSVVRMFGRQVRARSVEDVLDELERYRGGGDKTVFFYDDNFVVSKPRTRELLQGMLARNLAIAWSAQVRADVVYKNRQSREIDRELLGLMRDSGCVTVYCGFESVNPATLDAYDKRQDVQDIRDSVRAFHDYGIAVHGMFVVGADTDDAETIERTVDFALENKIDTAQFLMLTPLPGTPFYERVRDQGRLLTEDWSLYDGHHCVVQPAQMSPYDLQMGAYRAMTRFYSARYALSIFLSNLTRNLPFLLSLLWRERKLRLQLPRVALLSLIPSRWGRLLEVLRRTVSLESWNRIRNVLMVPGLRLYGYVHVRQWTRQENSRAYLSYLRRSRWSSDRL